MTTKRFNEQVKRNLQRFTGDFMFQLTPDEYAHLRSQFATSSSCAHGGRRHLPYVFTEHGAFMAARDGGGRIGFRPPKWNPGAGGYVNARRRDRECQTTI